MMVLQFFLVLKYLPETKGVSLEQLQRSSVPADRQGYGRLGRCSGCSQGRVSNPPQIKARNPHTPTLPYPGLHRIVRSNEGACVYI